MISNLLRFHSILQVKVMRWIQDRIMNMNEGVHKDDTVMSHVFHRYEMSKIRGQIVKT